MTAPNPVSAKRWTRIQTAMLAVVCLLVGIAGGWSIGGFHDAGPLAAAKSATASASSASQPSTATQPASDQLKRAADAQAAPLIDRLKSNPKDPAVLTELGNVYYDAQQYSTAVGYYRRALDAKPDDTSVRTDMATAYWYMGQADMAIAEFNKVLGQSSENPNALFNRGIVKWQGKKDAAGALADWNELLASDPSYPQKDKVQEMIARVQKQQAPASRAASR